MKILKIIGFLLLAVIVIVLIAGAIMPKDFHYEMSKTINAPKSEVWNNIVMYENHEKWSQWKKIDPNMQTTLTGTDGTIGAKLAWKSDHKDVGNGSQTIKSIKTEERIDYEMDFGTGGKPTSFFTVAGDSSKTDVTWGMDMHVEYPFNAIAGMFMSEKMMNDMFETGLTMLKTESEKK